jgi:hypothetical protein
MVSVIALMTADALDTHERLLPIRGVVGRCDPSTDKDD